MKLYAIVDTGEMNGDCLFYCPDDRVDYQDGMTIEDIKTEYVNKLIQTDGEERRKEAEEIAFEIKIAWIVNNKALQLLESGGTDCWNDSQVYMQNRMLKEMARNLCIRVVE